MIMSFAWAMPWLALASRSACVGGRCLVFLPTWLLWRWRAWFCAQALAISFAHSKTSISRMFAGAVCSLAVISQA